MRKRAPLQKLMTKHYVPHTIDYDEGWHLFSCDDGFLRVKRLDCARDAGEHLPHEPIFESDDAAIEFVAKKALDGSLYHVGALALHGTKERNDH